MKKMIDVRLSVDGEIFMTCNYVWLEPNAPNTGRKFVFSNIKKSKYIIDNGTNITVDINVANIYKKKFNRLNQFKILVIENYKNFELPDKEWSVYGEVCNNSITEYRQGKLDAFYTWQRGEQFDWFGLPSHSSLKLDYISACRMYSGLGIKMAEREIYSFELSLVKASWDFFYLAGIQFIGEKGYMGHDFHTFKDCLLEMYHHNNKEYFVGKKIVFFNMDRVYNSEISKLLEDIKEVFLNYGCLINHG